MPRPRAVGPALRAAPVTLLGLLSMGGCPQDGTLVDLVNSSTESIQILAPGEYIDTTAPIPAGSFRSVLIAPGAATFRVARNGIPVAFIECQVPGPGDDFGLIVVWDTLLECVQTATD